MADISLIIDVQQKGVVKAVKDTKSLENNAKLLSKAFKAGDLSQRQYYKGIAQLSKETKRSETELRKYATTIRRVEAETKRAKLAQDAERLAVRKYAQARRDATAANLRFNAEQRKVTQEAKELTNTTRKLSMEFKQGYAAQQRFDSGQKRLTRALKLGIVTSEEYYSQLQRLKVASDQLAASSNRSSRSMNRAGMVMQQTGYQVGDFLVQVQGGTNAMVAFGQQATQMAGLLTVIGKTTAMIALGAALSIIIPLATALGAAWMRTRKAADEVSKAVKTFENRLESARDEMQGMVEDLDLLNSGFGTLSELTLSNAIDQAKDSLKEAREELEAFVLASENIARTPEGAAINFLTGLVTNPEGNLEEAREAYLLTVRQLAALQEMQRQNQQRERDEAVINGLHEARIYLQDQEAEKRKESEARLIRIRGIMGDLTVEARAAAIEAGEFAKALIVLSSANRQDASTYSGRGSGTEWSGTGSSGAFEPTQATLDAYNGMVNPTKTGGGSSGASSAPQVTPLETMVKEIALMEELRGKTEEYTYVRNKLGDTYSEFDREAVAGYEAQYAAIQDLIDLDQERASLATSIADSIGDGYTAMVEGTMSVKDAFKSMAKDIIKQLWDVLVMQRLIGSVGVGGGVGATGVAGFIGGLLGFDGGGYTGSGARSGGVDGKGGFMAMLHPQETVVDHTKGQSSGGTTVQQTLNFNFSANGDETVKKLIAQAAPQIAKMTKSSMLDDRRRGGATKAAFG